ncbi:MAG: hydantoinase/oxoprolinase family protein, partial [Parvibaculum sp.]|nr:hydantoinase/oxoprolinase family protein [Parvibaculum sp.]
LESADDLMEVLSTFSKDYGRRYGEGSQAPEAGIRVNTIRVATYSSMSTLKFKGVLPEEADLAAAPVPSSTRDCHFVGHAAPLATGFYDLADLSFGAVIEAPAVVISPSTTYLVEPGWRLRIGRYGAALFVKV